jgi:trigger factor
VKLTITDITDTRKDVVITISGEEIASEEQKILKEFSKHARIPGFRPGKAPEARIRARFGKQIGDELKNTVIRKAFDEVSKSEEIELYRIVEFPDPSDFHAGTEASLDMTVDVVPQFDLPVYKEIKVQLPAEEVSDSEIDEAIEQMRQRAADFVVVEREAAQGDYVKVSYSGKVGDEAVDERLADHPRLRSWGSVTDAWEEAGTEQAKEYGVPAIIDALVGMKAGDSKTVEQVVADDFAVEELRGQTVAYEVTVSEVRERKLPDLDNADFLKQMGAESEAELKANVLDQLEQRKKQEGDNAKRKQILDHLVSVVDFPLPESAVEEETQRTMARIMGHNMQQGVPEEVFEQNKEELHRNASVTAAREVKLQLLLNRIAKEEAVEVSNEDLSRAVYSIAMQQRQRPEDLAKELRKDRSQVVQLQRQILFSKTLEKVAETAVVERVAAAPAEAEGENAQS